MRMNTTKTIIVLIIASLVLSIISSCSSAHIKSMDPVNIAMIFSISDDESKVNTNVEEIKTLACRPGSNYAFISAEGKPSSICEPGIVADLSDRGYTDTMLDRVRSGISADFANKIDSYKPSTSEINMADAIKEGVRTLKANAIEGRKNVLVLYCSGRSTTGIIDMTKTPLYMVDIDESVKAVSSEMAVDMSLIDEVVWYCAGDCGGNQPVLSANEQAKMKEFYNKLFKTLGAKNIQFKEDLPSSEHYEFDDTYVSSMEVEGVKSGLKQMVIMDPDIFEDGSEEVLDEPIVIPESQISYKPDSAVFLNKEAAIKIIQPLAKYMIESKRSILLYGTCAGDKDTSYTKKLALARADAVKDLLVQSGVDEKQIKVISVAIADDPYYQYGLGTGKKASVNRKTVIVDLDSSLANELLSKAK